MQAQQEVARIAQSVKVMDLEQLIKPLNRSLMMEELKIKNPIVGDLVQTWTIEIRRRALSFNKKSWSSWIRSNPDWLNFTKRSPRLRLRSTTGKKCRGEEWWRQRQYDFAGKKVYIKGHPQLTPPRWEFSWYIHYTATKQNIASLHKRIRQRKVAFSKIKKTYAEDHLTKNLKGLNINMTRWSSRLIKQGETVPDKY